MNRRARALLFILIGVIVGITIIPAVQTCQATPLACID